MKGPAVYSWRATLAGVLSTGFAAVLAVPPLPVVVAAGVPSPGTATGGTLAVDVAAAGVVAAVAGGAAAPGTTVAYAVS